MALAEAKTATALDPKSSVAWQTLAWAYQHDTFGRRMQGNWNFAEAEKCYRKALEVDPEDQTARADLAILLEHNANGWRYAKDARLGEAIETYREAIKKNPLPLFQQNLTIALLRAGQLDAAKEESKKCSPELQSGLLAMISAIQDGPAKVVVGAQGAFPDPRQRAQYLAGVAFTLVQLRQYAAAQVVMSAAARLAVSQEFQTRAEGFSKLKRWEDALVAEDDPRWPVQRFLMEAFRGNFTLEMVKSVMSKRADFSTWDHGMVSVQNTLAAARHAISSQGMEEETLVDLVLSMASFEQDGMSVHGEAKTVSKPGSREMTTVTFANEGEKYGYRIKMSMPGGSSSQTMYVIREDGKYKLLGSPPDGLELIGELALELLEKGDTRGAQWWLDKVVANIEPRSDGTGMPAVHALWSGVTPESRGPAAIRLASASLIGAGTGNAKAVQTLQEARAKAANSLDRAQADKAICEALSKAKKWQDLMVAGRRLASMHTFSEEGFRYFVKGATGAKKWKELDIEAQKRVTENARNLTATRALALAKIRLGDFAGAAPWIKKLTEDPVAGTEERIFAAWTRIASGKVDQEALTKFKGTNEGSRAPAKFQYTLAMMHALLDAPDDAQQALLLGIDQEDYIHLSAAAWVVYGKICEQYGFPTEAVAAFARAKDPAQDDDELAEWSLPLAKPGAQTIPGVP